MRRASATKRTDGRRSFTLLQLVLLVASSTAGEHGRSADRGVDAMGLDSSGSTHLVTGHIQRHHQQSRQQASIGRQQWINRERFLLSL